MICVACRNRKHDRGCPGDTWCDCQHRTLESVVVAEEVTVEPESDGERTPALSD